MDQVQTEIVYQFKYLIVLFRILKNNKKIVYFDANSGSVKVEVCDRRLCRRSEIRGALKIVASAIPMTAAFSLSLAYYTLHTLHTFVSTGWFVRSPAHQTKRHAKPSTFRNP